MRVGQILMKIMLAMLRQNRPWMVQWTLKQSV